MAGMPDLQGEPIDWEIDADPETEDEEEDSSDLEEEPATDCLGDPLYQTARPDTRVDTPDQTLQSEPEATGLILLSLDEEGNEVTEEEVELMLTPELSSLAPDEKGDEEKGSAYQVVIPKILFPAVQPEFHLASENLNQWEEYVYKLPEDAVDIGEFVD